MFLTFNEIKYRESKKHMTLRYYKRENHLQKVVRKVVESFCDEVVQRTMP